LKNRENFYRKLKRRESDKNAIKSQIRSFDIDWIAKTAYNE
jgi:hypothetical protein